MKKMITVSQEGKVIYSQIEVASTFTQRFWGLMGREQLGEEKGLLLERCSCIHTCFMRFAIDVVYLDQAFTVLDYETVRPWRRGSRVKGARHVLELPANAGSQLRRGHPIELKMITNSQKGEL